MKVDDGFGCNPLGKCRQPLCPDCPDLLDEDASLPPPRKVGRQPTESGYYWLLRKVGRPLIVQVWDLPDDPTVAFMGSVCDQPLAQVDGDFVGPLKSPVLSCESSWQPIETAPKDGRAILTFDPAAYSTEKVLVGWWSDKGGWLVGEGFRHQPTHWMPLPTPPSTTADPK